MASLNVCPECGTSHLSNDPKGRCPRCLPGNPEAPPASDRRIPEPEGGSSAAPAADLAAFRQAVLRLRLAPVDEIDRLIEEEGGVATRVARSLVAAERLTPYQAGALLQGRARGLMVGPYLVLDKRGQGGMGAVFRARHRDGGPDVALKVLLPSFSRNREAVARFRREFEIASQLRHPNVVSALEASEDRGVQYLTMEFVDGCDLDAIVRDVGPLPIKMSIHCMIQAAQGLAAAHAQDIVHRDVKPANLMLAPSGMVRVLDLGLARVVEAANPLGREANLALTRGGSYLGSVDFIAPEQADDSKRATDKADIYSLGCTLYFLLTGRPPFGGDTALKRLVAHQQQPAPSLYAAREDIPGALEAAYQSMMSKRPSDRPQSMAEVIDLLKGCRSSADEAKQVDAGLRNFAEAAMKRAAPRKRGWGVDASVFAQPTVGPTSQADPNLKIEDLIMDFREEVHAKPLSEEKLPPLIPRLPTPRRRGRPRWPSPLLKIVAASMLVVSALVYLPGALKRPTGAPQSDTRPTVGPAPLPATGATFLPIFNGKDFAGWAPLGRTAKTWRVEDGALAVRGLEGTNLKLFTDRTFQDFQLRFDYQATPGTNAGLFLSSVERADRPRLFAEVEIADKEYENLYPGAFFGIGEEGEIYGKPAGSLLKPVRLRGVDAWNQVELSVVDGRISVAFNGRAVEYREELPRLEGPQYLGFDCIKGSIRLRDIEVREIEPPPSSLLHGDSHVDQSRRLLFVDAFEKPRPYWSFATPEYLAKNPDHAWGQRDGILFDEARTAAYYRGFLPRQMEPDFSLELIGRVTGGKPTSRGSFLLQVVSEGRGFQVKIDGTGALYIDPSPTSPKKGFANPWLGPIRHPAIVPGGAGYNTVRLEVRKRRLEIFVNSARVCDPMEFDKDLTASWISLGVDCQEPMVRAEFDRIEVRALPELAESAPPAPVKFFAAGATVDPDGTHHYEGCVLHVAERTGGDSHWQNDMQHQFQGQWSNDRHLLWLGSQVGDVLTLDLPIEGKGLFQIVGDFTLAPNYGRVVLALDGQPLLGGQFLDLYDPQVRRSDPVPLGIFPLTPGTKRLTFKVVGKNRSSGGIYFGLDEIRLVPVR